MYVNLECATVRAFLPLSLSTSTVQDNSPCGVHDCPLCPTLAPVWQLREKSSFIAFLLFQGASAAHTVTVLQVRDPNSLRQGTQRTTGAPMEPPPQGDAYQPKAAYVPKTLSSLIIPLVIHAHCIKQGNVSNNQHCHIQMRWAIIFPALS